MEQLFLLCSVVGGTIFLCQLALTLFGMGGDDFDVADDVPSDLGGADFGHFDGGGHVDAGGHGDVGGHAGHVHHGEVVHAHSSTRLFSLISFRTVVAALTFFGLTGYAALQGGQSPATSLVLALVCGGAAMYGVHRLMQLMYQLSQDRTLRIDNAVGRLGTVYIPIPAAHQGEGKVQISLQDRLVEYAATTAESADLPTGARIVVTRIVGPSVVEVMPVEEKVEAVGA